MTEIGAEQQICNSQTVQAELSDENADWKWLDLQINTSTEKDVEERLGKPTNVRLWPETGDDPIACVYDYTNHDDYISIWFAGGRIIAIEFSPKSPNPQFRLTSQPQTLGDAKNLYGRAESVTWSWLGTGIRSVAWVSRGIQADVRITGDNPLVVIRYFQPSNPNSFKNSRWAELVLGGEPPANEGQDVVDDAPLDPFEW